MGTKEVIARFEAERQALAMMAHPCIAKVHDASATQMGRPFFVMELVEGAPITNYCDQNNVSARQRMRRTGVEKAFGEDRIHDTATDGVKAFGERCR